MEMNHPFDHPFFTTPTQDFKTMCSNKDQMPPIIDEQEIDEIELAQLKLDAQRYRYLRTGAPYAIRYKDTVFHCGGHRVLAPGKQYPHAFDAAIDEAMKNA